MKMKKMSDRSKVFFGLTLGLLLSLIVLFLPLDTEPVNYKALIILGMVMVSGIIYDKG